MRKYTNFNKLNKTGQRAEKQFIEFLEQKGYTDIERIDDVYKVEGLLRSAWDIRCKNSLGVPVKFEVKAAYDCDEWGWTTIEQVQNGKVAGIVISKADYLVHVNDTLGFAIDEKDKFIKIHWELVKSTTTDDYKRKKEITLRDGQTVKLWITNYENWAAGFRVENKTLTWYK